MNFRHLRFSTAPQRANDKRPASAPTVDFVHFIIGLPIRRDRVSSLFWSAPCFIAELTNQRTGDLPARRVGPHFRAIHHSHRPGKNLRAYPLFPATVGTMYFRTYLAWTTVLCTHSRAWCTHGSPHPSNQAPGVP
jgi:hypothetical protein